MRCLDSVLVAILVVVISIKEARDITCHQDVLSLKVLSCFTHFNFHINACKIQHIAREIKRSDVWTELQFCVELVRELFSVRLL